MLLLLMAVAASISSAKPCDVDATPLLALPYKQFDETLSGGWRTVGDRTGCELAAADLIAEYREKNAAVLVNDLPDHIRSLDWHEGQLRAAAGQTETAIVLLKRGSRPSDEGGDSLYHAATLAFLKRDRGALLTLRDKIAVMPEPRWFSEAAEEARKRGMTVPPWPVHASEVSGFVNCFDKPYRDAYTYACRDHR